MRPITLTLPKPLVAIGGKPMLDHALDRLAEAGITDAIVNVHWLADRIEAHVAARDHVHPSRSRTNVTRFWKPAWRQACLAAAR